MASSQRPSRNRYGVTGMAFSFGVVAGSNSSGMGPLQGRNVDLLHLQHGFHDTSCLLGILVRQQLRQHVGNDLPGQAELVLQPPARRFLSALGKFAPEIVDLFLRLTVDLERYRLVELEMRTAIKSEEFLPFDFELHGHDRSRFPSMNLISFLAVAADLSDPGILKTET